ncbi:unnamed protein product [Rotaria socialis]|uniref:EGF-like domain-containing protein n=1 Tax=Rotaria socialis TaxID=392032 RepID=A0A820TKW6_9BILA|nr:unnamed protein product [Rotaria socialis]
MTSIKATTVLNCQVNNGECGSNATCSHDASTNAVVCSCKNGYVNSGTGSAIRCTDACQMNNGGCDSNAACSHDASTNGVVCRCNNGFVNTGCDTTVKCTDSCQVKNGGCDSNAACSHDASTNAVVCTCKSGYTNVPTGGVVTCIQVTTTLAPGTQKAHLNSTHVGSTNPGFQQGDCPVSVNGAFGWHFVLTGTSTSIVSIRCVFNAAGVVTSMIQVPSDKHAYVFTRTGDTLLEASAVVNGPDTEFNLSNVCNSI